MTAIEVEDAVANPLGKTTSEEEEEEQPTAAGDVWDSVDDRPTEAAMEAGSVRIVTHDER